MQYYIMAEWIRFLREEKGMTFDELLDACHYRGQDLEKFIRNGGPTRDIGIIGSLGRAFHEPSWKFAKIKYEDGDKDCNVAKIMQQEKLPLDYDESHFEDNSRHHRRAREAEHVKVEYIPDFEVMAVSRRLMQQNQEAYEVLAK